jgi:hypothetical protein
MLADVPGMTQCFNALRFLVGNAHRSKFIRIEPRRTGLRSNHVIMALGLKTALGGDLDDSWNV